MDAEEIALNIIRKHRDGIFQNKLWKEMGIDSRKCSRIVAKLLEEGRITRESGVSNGSRTYLLKVSDDSKPSCDLLLAVDEFSPCAGCRDACHPERCLKLTEWISIIIKNEKHSES